MPVNISKTSSVFCANPYGIPNIIDNLSPASYYFELKSFFAKFNFFSKVIHIIFIFFRMATTATARRSWTTRWGTWRVWWRTSTRSLRHLVSTSPPTPSARQSELLQQPLPLCPLGGYQETKSEEDYLTQWMKKSIVSVFSSIVVV